VRGESCLLILPEPDVTNEKTSILFNILIHFLPGSFPGISRATRYNISFFHIKNQPTANTVYLSLYLEIEQQVSAYVMLLYKNMNIKPLLFKKGKAFHFTVG
jgi:hypothetical protein